MQQLAREAQPVVTDYLNRLRGSLNEVSTGEREYLVEQARARIELELELDQVPENNPAGTQEVLVRLGDPAVLAQRLRSEAPPRLEEPVTGRLTACRSCRKEVSVEAFTCPHCGAPYPARATWRGWGYEWKSEKTLWGYPLVHVAFGRDEKGKFRVAKGIVAIGQFGIGAITIAQFGVGAIFGLGQFVMAPIAIGQFGIGLLFGLGQFATGWTAIGQIAVGNWVRAVAYSPTLLGYQQIGSSLCLESRNCW